MDKRKRELIIVSALLAVFVLSLGKHLFFRKRVPAKSGVSPSSAASVDAASVLLPLQQNIRLFEEQEKRWKEEWGRDPFSTAYRRAQAGRVEGLVLTGIVWDEAMPVAMVNNRVLKVNDEVDGFTVIEIKQSSIVFFKDGRQFELELFQ